MGIFEGDTESPLIKIATGLFEGEVVDEAIDHGVDIGMGDGALVVVRGVNGLNVCFVVAVGSDNVLGAGGGGGDVPINIGLDEGVAADDCPSSGTTPTDQK